MATYTENLNLKKPSLTDPASIGDINNNMDLIDGAFTNAIVPDSVTNSGWTFTASQYRSNINISLTPREGYVPIVYGVECSNNTNILIINYSANDTAIEIHAKNTSTSAQNSVTFRLKVLWIKNELIGG